MFAFAYAFLPPAYVVRQEGNSFTLFVSPHLGGGVPISHNALQHFPECHGAAGGGGTLPGPARGGTLPGPARGGCTLPGVPCWGEVPCQGGSLPGGTLLGGYPGRVPPRPGQEGGYPAREGTLLGGYPGRVPPWPGQEGGTLPGGR